MNFSPAKTAVAVLAASVCIATPGLAATCESLSSLSLPNATITVAKSVEAGAFTLPNGSAQQNAGYKNLPAFCRVAATLAPSSDSDIKIEVWLPASGWNGKYQGVGNGGWAGSITYGALAGCGAAMPRHRPIPDIRATSAAPASRWGIPRKSWITPGVRNTR